MSELDDFCLGTKLRKKAEEAKDKKYHEWYENNITATKLREKLIAFAEKGEFWAGFRVPEEEYTKNKDFWHRFANEEKITLKANYYEGDEAEETVMPLYKLVFSWQTEV